MPHETIRFEGFALDPRSFELRQTGRLLKLEPIPLQWLFLLAENRDRLVTREEIPQAIWGKDVFVDADNSINTAVRKARQALKDDPENPRFLRAIPGKGYGFTAQIEPPAPASVAKLDGTSVLSPAARRFPPGSRMWVVVGRRRSGCLGGCGTKSFARAPQNRPKQYQVRPCSWSAIRQHERRSWRGLFCGRYDGRSHRPTRKPQSAAPGRHRPHFFDFRNAQKCFPDLPSTMNAWRDFVHSRENLRMQSPKTPEHDYFPEKIKSRFCKRKQLSAALGIRIPDNPPEFYESPFGAAILLSQLGRKSAALDALEKAYEQRSLAMTELRIEPAFDPLRADPRFQSPLMRVGLVR